MPRAKQRTTELGERLLQSALEVLEAGDVALTARSVAAGAGTSTAALYELFGEKSGLLRAVFLEGFRRLERTLDGLPPVPDPESDLLALLAAFRRFGLDNPMLFEIMFARPFPEFRPDESDHAAAVGIHRAVMARVDRCLEAGVTVGNRTDIAQVLVATSRGLIAAELAGILASSAAGAQRRWRLGLATLVNGLRPRTATGA